MSRPPEIALLQYQPVATADADETFDSDRDQINVQLHHQQRDRTQQHVVSRHADVAVASSESQSVKNKPAVTFKLGSGDKLAGDSPIGELAKVCSW